MARLIQELPVTDAENVFKKVRKRIEEKFESVIHKIVERRDALLIRLEQWEQEYQNANTKKLKCLQELKLEKLEMNSY